MSYPLRRYPDVWLAIAGMLTYAGFVYYVKGDRFVRHDTGCEFSGESLNQYKFVTDFQLDYPLYATIDFKPESPNKND